MKLMITDTNGNKILNDKMYNRIKSHNVSEIHYKN